MKLPLVAVIEPKAAQRKALVQGLSKAGLAVSAALEVGAVRREGLVLIGPGVKDAAAQARAARKARDGVLVLAAQRRPSKAPWADGVLPLPLSPRDVAVRVPELLELRALKTRKAKKPAAERRVVSARPGEGILDPLTQFYTFAHFKEVLFIEVKRARRYGFPLSIALLAFDPLSREMTPQLRSQLMAGLALAIRRSLRDTDYPVQYGADRVLLLMPHTDLPGALVVSRRIVERVGRASLAVGKELLTPTLSAGVAATPLGKEISFGELAKLANDSLSAALAAGGNRVEFPSAIEPEPVPAQVNPAPVEGP